jgi:hypothetical protein
MSTTAAWGKNPGAGSIGDQRLFDLGIGPEFAGSSARRPRAPATSAAALAQVAVVRLQLADGDLELLGGGARSGAHLGGDDGGNSRRSLAAMLGLVRRALGLASSNSGVGRSAACVNRAAA